MSVEVQPETVGDNDLVKRLAKAFQETLALRVPVKITEAGVLPRFDLKAKRWIIE